MSISIKTLGIIGTGQMGTGIATVFLKYGYKISLYDAKIEAIHHCQEKIKKYFEKQQPANSSLFSKEIEKNITPVHELSALRHCDIVIEAAPENFSLKSSLLKDISFHLNNETILVTNTSSLSLTQLSASVRYPENFMGMHFMNPVPVIPLVELIKNPYTSAATAQAVTHLVSSIEKTPVYSMDSPGFIVNRILIPMIHEAILLLEQGIGTKEDIDIAMRLGTNQPIGPLALADLIGLDTCLAIMQVLEKELKSLKYAPCALLISMVEKGLLGRKVGQGFYPYKK